MLEQILTILYENEVPEEVVEKTMDVLISGLLGTLSPEDKSILAKQIKLDAEDDIAKA